MGEAHRECRPDHQNHLHEYASWVDRQSTNTVDLAHLFQPYPAGLMEIFQVSPLVNPVSQFPLFMTCEQPTRSCTESSAAPSGIVRYNGKIAVPCREFSAPDKEVVSEVGTT